MKTLLFTYDVEEILNGTGGETCMRSRWQTLPPKRFWRAATIAMLSRSSGTTNI